MPFDFCLPTKATTVPDTPDWLHEIKYDGYRLRLERDGDRVRLRLQLDHRWKRRDRPYQAGRSKHWVKVKNRKHPAMSWLMETHC